MVSLDEAVYVLTSHKRRSITQVNVENGNPSAAIDIHIDAYIDEEINDGRLNEKKITVIEKEANAILEEALAGLLEKLQSDQSDILGIGARIRAKYSDYWIDEVKTAEKWRGIYKDMDIKTNAHIQIKRTGMEWD